MSNYDIIVEVKKDSTINNLVSIKTKDEIRDENELVEMLKTLYKCHQNKLQNL